MQHVLELPGSGLREAALDSLLDALLQFGFALAGLVFADVHVDVIFVKPVVFVRQRCEKRRCDRS